ncbi:glycosyltransferase family 4 protein, partial [bacterium]|nr:glycosyltransferase family 4 protein [bacterium]
LNIHVVKKPKAFYIPVFTLIALRAMRRRIKVITPDIVHALGSFPPLSTVAMLDRNEYPTVMTLYGIATEELTKHLTSMLYALYERYIYSKIPNIIVPGVSIKNLISNNTSSKIYVVPHGIEYDKIQEIQPHLNDEPDTFYIGNLVKGKGVDTLLKAISEVLKSIPDLRVCIAGAGPEEGIFKTIVKKLNLGGHVKFFGFISENEKYQYYKASKIVVIPSRWDVSPITLYEAMASGKPVVASNIGGIPDLIDDGKTGFLFDPENVEDLSKKIIRLLTDEELRVVMGRAAREKARQYDWSNIADSTVEIYKEVIANFHD